MELPASQYSVLDAKRIERIDDDTFRCYVGGVNFLSFKVGPDVRHLKSPVVPGSACHWLSISLYIPAELY